MNESGRKYFFDVTRAALFRGSLVQSQVNGMNHLLEVWEEHFPKGDLRWLAYCLATAFHETAQTMQPVQELGRGKGYAYGKPAGPHGKVYYGRGHVQLTWHSNYVRAERELRRFGIDAGLEGDPELALEPRTSALILFEGMAEGWFTGKKLGEFFAARLEQPRNARRIVNGTDRMDLIASYYHKFKDALQPLPQRIEPLSGPQMKDSVEPASE